jgi:hypothetical protein
MDRFDGCGLDGSSEQRVGSHRWTIDRALIDWITRQKTTHSHVGSDEKTSKNPNKINAIKESNKISRFHVDDI